MQQQQQRLNQLRMMNPNLMAPQNTQVRMMLQQQPDQNVVQSQGPGIVQQTISNVNSVNQTIISSGNQQIIKVQQQQPQQPPPYQEPPPPYPGQSSQVCLIKVIMKL